MQSPSLRQAFPRLNAYEIVGPADKNVNAFGAALGVNQWINPPAGTADNPLDGVDRLFAQAGYQRQQGFDLRAEPGKEKIVLYVTLTPDGNVKDITSAAHQEADGQWTMKIGPQCKIRIHDLFQLQGPSYGLPYAVYTR